MSKSSSASQRMQLSRDSFSQVIAFVCSGRGSETIQTATRASNADE